MAKTKHKGGRPSKFDPKYIQALIKFFDIEPYKQIVTESMTESFKDGGVKKESFKYKMMPSKMPTLYRFSRKIGVDYSNVWRWAERGSDEYIEKKIAEKKEDITKEELETMQHLSQFRNAYKEAKELQKEFLINIGLAGAAPAPFAIFTAKNVTDMRDKVETDVTSGGDKIPVIIGMRIIKEETPKEDGDKDTTN
jgi:hypothetical protein